MEYISTTLGNLVEQTAFMNLTCRKPGHDRCCLHLSSIWQSEHGFEPLLLVPIAFGMLLVNIYPDIMITPEEASNGTGGLLVLFLCT